MDQKQTKSGQERTWGCTTYTILPVCEVCRMLCLPCRSDGDDRLLSSKSEVTWGGGVSLQAADGRTSCFVTHHVWSKTECV